ncbi:zinc ribbon domain-containing protein [Chloroflexota bacterium]
MPIYEYECLECGQRFEMHRSLDDNDIKIRCPKCGAGKMRCVFSVFSTNSTSISCAPVALPEAPTVEQYTSLLANSGRREI